jgi:enamine deaminase RidA (YjgF/YER057c/UK114 family)
MKIERVNSNEKMSQAVCYQGMVFLSGQVADDLTGDIGAQAREALEHVKQELEAAGTSIEKLLTTTVYLSDITLFDAMNQVWVEWFAGQPMPTRATVEARLADPCMLIEIVVTAAA